MGGVRMRVLVALAALAVLAAACGGDSNDAGAGGATTTGATAATGATDSGSGYDPGAGSRYGGSNGVTDATAATVATGANADVSVSLNNCLFDPATVRVSSGDVVAVRNGNAKTPHTFTLVGDDVDLELAPLTTETTTIDLAPGTYQLICRFHRSLGMQATLKVS